MRAVFLRRETPILLSCMRRHAVPVVGGECRSRRANLDNLRKLPLAFEKNHGKPAWLRTSWRAAPATASPYLKAVRTSSLRHGNDHAPATVDLRLIGARRDITAVQPECSIRDGELLHRQRPCPLAHEHSDLRRVEYSGVYGGIDLAYYGSQGRLEYDFVVKPGADPSGHPPRCRRS
jgi:hypothetical protein